MTELQVAYDPAVWIELDGHDGSVPGAVSSLQSQLAAVPRTSGSPLRLLLAADPIEPPIVAELSLFVLSSPSSLAAAAVVFPEAGPEELDEVSCAGGVAACRYLRFVQAAEFLPGEAGEEMFVAELQYARTVEGVDGGCVLVASVVTPRITDLAGIAEQVEALVGMVSPSGETSPIAGDNASTE